MTYQPHEYKHIRAWGEALGSYEYYISNQQQLAAEQIAPLNALYRNTEKEWITADNLSPAQKAEIDSIVAKM